MVSKFTRDAGIKEALIRGDLVHALAGGTPAMTDAGQKYLPKYLYEDKADYDNRLSGGVLLNGYKRTKEYLTGQVFSKSVSLSDDATNTEDFDDIVQNADLQGNNLRTWAQKVFEAGIDDGMAAVLVDFPTVRTKDVGGVLYYYDDLSETWRLKTKEADAANGWRPFFTFIEQQQILGGRYEIINSSRKLTMLRILENVASSMGETDAEDEYIEQVRILRPGSWELWRKSEDDEYLYDSGSISLDVIPVAFFKPGDAFGDIACVPALEDLAQICKRHWVATCDQNSMMAYVRRPPWFGKMLHANEMGQIEFSPGRLVCSNESSGDLRSIGIDASAVNAGRLELQDLQNQMALYGLLTLAPTYSSGAKTAFQSQTEVSESTSWLKDVALAFKDTLENAFGFAAMFMGLEFEEAPAVEINTEFNAAFGLDTQAMMVAVDRGILPKQIAYEELVHRGFISDSVDWEEVKTMLGQDERDGLLLKMVDKEVLPRQVLFEEIKRRGMIAQDLDWQDVQAMRDDDNRTATGPTGALFGL